MTGKNLNYNEIRLIRYSKLIDQAILSKRYSLATHLAYRCLLEYYRLFARFIVPHRRYLKKNAFQLSLSFVKYLRKGGLRYRFKTRQLMKILSASYQITRFARWRAADRDLHVDLAMATFAKDNALAISRLVMGSLTEHQTNQPE